MVTPNFLFGYQEHLLSFTFSTCKNIPVLVNTCTTNRKPKYLEMHRMYAQ